jgi:hypothetical protein
MHIENLVPESNDDARSPSTSSQCIITRREPAESLGQSRHIMLGQQRHRIGQPAKGYLERIFGRQSGQTVQSRELSTM